MCAANLFFKESVVAEIRKHGNRGFGRSMSNQSIFMLLARAEILTQKQILMRSTVPGTRLWRCRETFLSRLCKGVKSIEEKEFEASIVHEDGVEPPEFKGGRGCRYLVGDLIDALENTPFHLAMDELLACLDYNISALAGAAFSTGQIFDLDQEKDREDWQSHIAFIYMSSAEELSEGAKALKGRRSHPLADRIRELPHEVLIGICELWLPHDSERMLQPSSVPEPLEDESEQEAEIIRFPIGKLKMWTLAAICFCFFGYGLARYFAPPEQVYQTISQDGPEVARTLETDPNDPDGMYSDAYAAYRAGKFAEAKQGVYAVLAINGDNKKREADCIYLLGMIATVSGAAEEGLGLADVAEPMYADLGSDLGVFNTLIEKARAYCQFEDFAAAQDTLVDARDIYDRAEVAGKKAYLPSWYTLAYEVALSLENEKLALSLAREKLYLFPEEPNFERGISMSELGFALCINGYLEEAEKVINIAQELLAESEYGLRYLGTTKILLKRARGEIYHEHYDDILAYAHEQNLPDLEVALEQVVNWPIKTPN